MFVDKVLQGPLDDVHAPYINIEGQKMKKSFVKFTDRMKDACNSYSRVSGWPLLLLFAVCCGIVRLHFVVIRCEQYRQHMCFAAVPLFKSDGSLTMTKGGQIKDFWGQQVGW